MSTTFHLAIEVGDVEVARRFYVDVLGCEQADHELPNWLDVNLWGNELTLHSSNPEKESMPGCHDVDAMGTIPVPHFGVHLEANEFKDLKEKLLQENVEFVDKPYIRFEGDVLEQETMFIKDPNGNILELKTMVNPDALFGEK